MSEKKKKPSRMKVKSKISKTNTSLKIGLTVVLIYWSIIKWVILIVIKGSSKVWHYIKRSFFSIKRRLISIEYRSIIKRSFKLIGKFFYNILKIPVIILLSPFLLLRKIYRSFNKLEVKFRLLSYSSFSFFICVNLPNLSLLPHLIFLKREFFSISRKKNQI